MKLLFKLLFIIVFISFILFSFTLLLINTIKMIHLHRSAKLSKQDLRNMRKYDLIKKKERIASEIKSEENDLHYFQDALNDTSRELSEEGLLALHNLVKDSKEEIERLKNELKELTK